MISRASRHDPRCKGVEGGTFHSFAYRTLKKYSKRIGFPDSFLVLDESDAEEAVHRCAARAGHYEKKKRFPKKGTLRSIISISINKNTTVGEVIKREYPHFIEYLAEIERLRKDYAAYKIDKNYLETTGTSWWWATTRRASTGSGAPPTRTSWSSRSGFRAAGSSSWRTTTGAPSPSWTWRTHSLRI
jgi:hypothetical protein